MNKIVTFLITLLLCTELLAQGIIIDHSCTDITAIPASAITAAKSQLKIAYGHTSHGSQLTEGMSGLVGFANNGGLGLNLPQNIFAFNSTGSGGALELHDYAMGGDVGYWPDWYNNTISYLNDPANSDINVIIWSWCGQASSQTQQSMLDHYLLPMTQLETMYPNVTFVYMTGHADGSGLSGNLHIRNQQIRQYCIDNNKVLYDFYDIECYDPDDNYFGDKFVYDSCDYTDNGTTKNWATQWQNSHTQNVDWYSCGSAHSQPLNANRKAYAAWWLWASLAGWNQSTNQLNPATGLTAQQQNDNFAIELNWSYTPGTIAVENFIIQRQVDGGLWQNNYATVSFESLSYVDPELSVGTYSYRIVAHTSDDGSGLEHYATASNIATVTLIEDVTKPNAPDGLEVGYNGESVIVTWNDNADNEQYYALERQMDDGDFVVIAGNLAADSSDYTDSDIEPAHSYAYQVRAGNIAGLSSYSNASEVWVPAGLSTLTLQTTAEVEDAFLFAAAPNTNYGSTNYVDTIDRYICRFNLPAALQGKRIVNAELEFYGWSLDHYQPDQYMQLYRVSSSWLESSVTWNSSQTGSLWQTPGSDFDPERIGEILITNTDHAYYPALDITPLLQSWVDGRLANNGLLLVDESGSGTGLKASEYSNNARTRLRITYTDFNCSLASDLVTDHRIDMLDFAALAGIWLTTNSENDLAGNDDYIDIADLSVLAEEWLTDCWMEQD